MEKIELFRAYFTDEIDYYENQLKKYEKDGICSFNFWAGFFGMTWFVYRRMYVQTFVIAVVLFIFAIISAMFLQIFNPNDSSNETYNFVIIYILSFVILGFIGNASYMKKSIKIVDRFSNRYGLENIDQSLKKSLKKQGGIDFISAIIFVVGMSIFQAIIKYLL